MALNHKYNAAAPNWRQMLENHGFPAAYRQLASAAPQQRALRLIDIGAGSADFTRAYCDLRQRPVHLTFLDRAQAMIDEARRAFPMAHCTCQDLMDFTPPAPFDVILCAHVIEHCPCSSAALTQIAKLLTPGGTLLLAVSRPHICQALIWPKWRHRWFSPRQVQTMGAVAGLSLMRQIAFRKGVPARLSHGYVFTKPKGAPLC